MVGGTNRQHEETTHITTRVHIVLRKAPRHPAARLLLRFLCGLLFFRLRFLRFHFFRLHFRFWFHLRFWLRVLLLLGQNQTLRRHIRHRNRLDLGQFRSVLEGLGAEAHFRQQLGTHRLVVGLLLFAGGFLLYGHRYRLLFLL